MEESKATLTIESILAKLPTMVKYPVFNEPISARNSYDVRTAYLHMEFGGTYWVIGYYLNPLEGWNSELGCFMDSDLKRGLIMLLQHFTLRHSGLLRSNDY